MKQLPIEYARASVLFKKDNPESRHYSFHHDSKHPIQIENLSEDEIESLGGIDYIIANGCTLRYNNHHYLQSGEEVLVRNEAFFDGADETRRIIFSILEEISTKEISRYKRHKGLEAIVDKLQEDDHPQAENFLALFNILKAVETIRTNRKKLRKLPDRYLPKEEQIGNRWNYNRWNFNEELGIVKEKDVAIKINNTHAGTKTNIEPVLLKDIPIDSLLGVLIEYLDRPSTVTI